MLSRDLSLSNLALKSERGEWRSVTSVAVVGVLMDCGIETDTAVPMEASSYDAN